MTKFRYRFYAGWGPMSPREREVRSQALLLLGGVFLISAILDVLITYHGPSSCRPLAGEYNMNIVYGAMALGFSAKVGTGKTAADPVHEPHVLRRERAVLLTKGALFGIFMAGAAGLNPALGMSLSYVSQCGAIYAPSMILLITGLIGFFSWPRIIRRLAW
jgi:hypothetical protein